MLQKTTGIVLTYIKYRDSSIIVKIFTRSLGLQSYIINGIRSSKSKNRIGVYQPLTLLELVVYHKEDANIQRISEARIFHPYQQLPFDMAKSTIAIFLTEFFSRILHQNYSNEDLYDFLQNALIQFDTSPHKANFHIQVLLKSALYLGFYPENGEALLEEAGVNVSGHEDEADYINQLLHGGLFENVKAARDIRRVCIRHVLAFYELHIPGIGSMKSLDILQSLMNE